LSLKSPSEWNAISLGPFYELNDNLTVAYAHYKQDLKTEEEIHGQNHPDAVSLQSQLEALR
jgi:hypothetical protein